jgi:hypothetical protein
MSEQAAFSPADPQQVDDQKKKVRREDELAISDLRKILSMPEGKRFFQRLIHFCGVAQSPWDPNALIHKNCGFQEVGHHVLRQIVVANRKVAGELLAESYERQAKAKGVIKS